jgi:zinc transport system permease protein
MPYSLSFLDPFLLRAVAAGIGVALAAGALGCFVVWRRMAYFGDSLAHSSLLGVALGLALGIGPHWGVAVVCSGFAVLLVWLQRKHALPTDTLLGILAHAALSVGMVAVSLAELPGFNVERYLFGDVLSVSASDVGYVYVGAAIVLLLLARHWPSLVLMTLHEDLAKAEGINTFRMHLLLVFLMAATVSVSVRIVGMLLITSLLIIPAATARQLTRSPHRMAVAASLLGAASVLAGVFASARFDTPSGPSIVAAAALMFALLFPLSLCVKKP